MPVRRTQIYVQAGAFTPVANAVRLRARLASLGNVQISKALVGADSFYRVRLGPMADVGRADQVLEMLRGNGRSEEHTSELQSLMRISYAVFCLKKKKNKHGKKKE